MNLGCRFKQSLKKTINARYSQMYTSFTPKVVIQDSFLVSTVITVCAWGALHLYPTCPPPKASRCY